MRVYRAKDFKRCGRAVHFGENLRLSGVENISLGDNVHIGSGAFIRGEGGLSIGDNTHISRNLVLYTINHNYNGVCLPYDNTMIEKPVTIGRNVWIGMNVCIAPGATIGDGAIIGLGAVVFGNVPPLAIIGVAQWQVIGMRDREHYEELERAGKFGGMNGRPL